MAGPTGGCGGRIGAIWVFLTSSFGDDVEEAVETGKVRQTDLQGLKAMRTMFVLLAMVLPAPALAEGADPSAYAYYDVLEDYPGCTGQGFVAYKATFDTELDDAGYFRPAAVRGAAACTIKMRRGLDVIELPFPCTDPTDATPPRPVKVLQGSYCELTAELRPVTIRLKGDVIGCVTPQGHALIGGNWEATTTRPGGTSVARGRYNDPRLEVRYASTDGYAYYNFGLELEEDRVPGVPEASVRHFGVRQLVGLVDKSDAKCIADPGKCWFDRGIRFRLSSKQDLTICPSDDSGVTRKIGITMEVPEREGE